MRQVGPRCNLTQRPVPTPVSKLQGDDSRPYEKASFGPFIKQLNRVRKARALGSASTMLRIHIRCSRPWVQESAYGSGSPLFTCAMLRCYPPASSLHFNVMVRARTIGSPLERSKLACIARLLRAVVGFPGKRNIVCQLPRNISNRLA